MLKGVDRTHLVLGLLVLLGIGWRAIDPGGSPPSAPSPEGVAQLKAVDSARSARDLQKAGKKAPKPTPKLVAIPPESGLRAESTPVGAAERPPTRPSPTEARVLIDIESASASEIETLPRIGPALARRIVDDRKRNGRFVTLEGLQRVKGIGPRVAAQLAEYVTFGLSGRPTSVTAAGAPEHTTPRKTRLPSARVHDPPPAAALP